MGPEMGRTSKFSIEQRPMIWSSPTRFFKKRNSHLATYTSVGRLTQIDYWFIGRCNLKLVMDAKVIPSKTIASQHRLLVLDLLLNLCPRPCTRLTVPEKIKCWHLPKRTTATLNTHIVAIDDDQPIKTLLANVTKTNIDEVGECLGATKPGQRFVDKQV